MTPSKRHVAFTTFRRLLAKERFAWRREPKTDFVRGVLWGLILAGKMWRGLNQ